MRETLIKVEGRVSMREDDGDRHATFVAQTERGRFATRTPQSLLGRRPESE